MKWKFILPHPLETVLLTWHIVPLNLLQSLDILFQESFHNKLRIRQNNLSRWVVDMLIFLFENL